MEKIKLFTDNVRVDNFKSSISTVMKQCNMVISVFNQKQPFVKITSLQDAESLLLGPLGYYDITVLQNSQIAQQKGLEINVAKLCELYGIDRPGYMAELGISDDDCPDCHKPKVKVKNESLIDYSNYQQYSQYLLFSSEGLFILNEETAKEKLASFDVYCTDEKQAEVYKHFQNLFTVLQKHYTLGLIGPVVLQQLFHSMGDCFKLVDNEMYMNEMNIAFLMNKIN